MFEVEIKIRSNVQCPTSNVFIIRIWVLGYGFQSLITNHESLR